MASKQSSANDVPSWIQAPLFDTVFKEICPEFRQTKDFKAKRALSAGENYATIMLRVEGDVELNDGSTKTISLMLKAAHENEMLREMMKKHNVFDVEEIIYREVIPELEQMYKDAGAEVKFGAQSYQLPTDQPYILLEDLKPKGFVNVNRLEGLDMDHTHCVLKKLAQWHAASATRVAVKGPYCKQINESFFKPETREMMKPMFKELSKIKMDCLKTFEGHELYYERMNERKDIHIDEFFDAGSKVDPDEFNVLNHGDCWANNIMFKHDAFGKIKETYLVDFQIPRYGSPAQDLYYFLLSSTKYEIKIKYFDHFIKYYFNELTEHLKLLSYPKRMPQLKDIHIMLHKYSAWGLSTVTGVMSVVLLDPQDDANLNNFIGDGDAGVKLKVQMYSNPRYRKHCEMLLPWLYNRGAIYFSNLHIYRITMSDQDSAANDIPSWIEASLFEPVFKEILPDFHQTTDFKAKRALSAGENYATIMLHVEADIELKDGSLQTLTLMLKTAHDHEMLQEMMKSHNVFDVEASMYREVVPEFEQIYQDTGIEVKFGAKSYQLNTDQPYILLEDLKPKGFININRLEGLDMEHIHSVLKKLAQWHAVSATRVALKGPYSKQISESFFREETREMMKTMFSDLYKIQMDCVKLFDGHELYYERMCKKMNTQIDEFFKAATTVDPDEFNVLNHGDCWSNNVMFKHDAFGNIEETYLVDYQIPRYGSPAQDLYYFLLSSAKYELKIKHFDYFIKYYHDELMKYLRLLNYPKKMPSLRDIHIMLYKHIAWAFSTVTGVMAVVLLDPHEDANLTNFVGESDAGQKLKIEMYSNPRYRKHCEMLLPWLYYRGAI
ncbi:uncharacterized protein ACRADG_013296 [Cochliomyia hominivorax]